jgi:ankyrin repeat protein
MRLLHTTKRKLEEFGSNTIPLYAILSHTWGSNEITFQDIEAGDAEKRVEYEKIRNTCSLAAAHGFDYVWIDTCCIDKTSSAELSEAINSMYRWYQESGVCYAYLADVLFNPIDQQIRAINPDFSRSKWFTRGWTLQELIAPSTVIFLDQEWKEIGTKSSLQWMISEITGIPANILLGGDLECASIAQRMSWASKRATTRLEDLAYCLMGIFGVNMPMLYGEGERAFIRLQEEIMKISDDHSLFAWESADSRGGLLAASPAAFINSGKIVPFNSSSTLSGAINVNNKGIHLNLGFIYMEPMSFQGVMLAILPCTVEGKGGERVAIFVRAMSETKEYFMRTNSFTLELLNPEDLDQSKYRERIICVRQERLTRKTQSALPKAAAYGSEAVVKLLLEKGTEPESEDIDGRVSLSRAAENGHKVVVRLLLENGAELESRDKEGRTPLSWAARNGHEAVVKLLLEEGADPESKDGDYWTPLSRAAENGHEAIVELLVEKGAELESKDKYGRTPLLGAAENGHEAVVKLLLKKGANPESKDRDGWTPLLGAAENGYEAVVGLLLEKSTKLQSRGKLNLRPLSRADTSFF